MVEEEEEEDSGSDADGEGPKLRSSAPMNSNPVPLGWPKVCIVLCVTHKLANTYQVTCAVSL